MFRSAPRFIAHQAVRASPLRACAPARRSLSTAPPAHKRRSWKSLVARLGVAGAIVYYYNTTDVFGEDPRDLAPVHAVSSTNATDADALPTLESIAAERAQRKTVQRHLELQREKEAAAATEQPQLSGENAPAPDAAPQEGGIEGLQAEADQQGAFNPETGEINWDCPCLGGMATGPCGEEFKAAFSCFVYSQEEPKGMDCIDKFKDMQGCFRQYPEIYGSEIDNDNDDDEEGDDMTAAAAAETSTPTPSPAIDSTNASEQDNNKPAPNGPHSAEKLEDNRRELGLVPENYRPQEKAVKTQEPTSESETLVPKAAHDSR